MNDFYDVLKQGQKAGRPQYTSEEYKEYKRAEREAAFDLIQTQLEDVLHNPEKFSQYLQLQSRLDRYSVSNAMLVLAQCPNASQLKDYVGWSSKGVSIHRGQKAISILEPYPYMKEDGTEGVGYNVKKVFDISQTTDKFKTQRQQQVSERQIFGALVENSPVMILAEEENECGEQNAKFDLDKQVIYMKRGLDVNTFFHTLVGEVIRARLSLEGHGNENREHQFAADCTAYMLAKEFGFTENGELKVPKLPVGIEAETCRDELDRGRQLYSKMKTEIYLEAEKERKAEREAR